MSCVICCDALFDDFSRLNSPKAGKRTDTGDWERQPAALGCGHVFHLGCIGLWLEQSNKGTCPTCRKVHKKHPIGLYFEADESSASAAGSDLVSPPSSTIQVTHRNQIIQTLCQNAKAAQEEIKQAKERNQSLVQVLQAREKTYSDQTQKVKKLEEKVTEAKKRSENWKKLELKYMTDLARRDSMIEQLTAERDQLKLKADELVQLKTSVDEINTSNGRLQRALKKERARNGTLTDMNQKLVTKMHTMEEKPGDLERSPTARSLSQMPQESQALDVIIEDADTSLTEIEPVVANTWTMPPAAKPVTKLKPTYNVPVSKFAGAALFGESKPASEAKPAVTPFTFSASPTNPFSVAGANPPSTITPAGLFGFKAQPPASSSRMPESLISKSLYKTGDLKTSHFGFAKPNALFVSDGMGGSRSRYATKKTTTQAKLPWGPKKT